MLLPQSDMSQSRLCVPMWMWNETIYSSRVTKQTLMEDHVIQTKAPEQVQSGSWVRLLSQLISTCPVQLQLKSQNMSYQNCDLCLILIFSCHKIKGFSSQIPNYASCVIIAIFIILRNVGSILHSVKLCFWSREHMVTPVSDCTWTHHLPAPDFPGGSGLLKYFSDAHCILVRLCQGAHYPNFTHW